jgi:hypothetical protein
MTFPDYSEELLYDKKKKNKKGIICVGCFTTLICSAFIFWMIYELDSEDNYNFTF